MPSLDELRTKWFLNFSTTGTPFPPLARHKKSDVKDYTDGNLVTPLFEGANYMREWHDQIVAMTGQQDCEVYYAAWRFDGVNTLGESLLKSNALDVLNDADNKGVTLIPLLCRNLLSLKHNNLSIIWLRAHGIWNATLDSRFPAGGSNHQKFAIFKRPGSPAAILGSLDITKSRWDRGAHSPEDSERHPEFLKVPTHEVGVRLQGPAVADVERTFRERWNDSSRSFGIEPLLPTLPLITKPVVVPAAAGTHSVQVLRTYGRTSTVLGYSWALEGEFTIWASYLNAIKTAASYIYIEDQYFFSFDWPPCFGRSGVARDTDLLYQLGEAIKRGVKVVVLVPEKSEDALHLPLDYQRSVSAFRLATVAAKSTGDFVIAKLNNGISPIFVHSKLMICDDELVLVGSANFNQRSMTHDSELHIAVVDGANVFARDFRAQLWSEHLQRSLGTLQDPIAAYSTFKADVLASRGRVRPFPINEPGQPSSGHGKLMRMFHDPYAGPVPR